MANYYATTRTNYFSVTDPDRLADLVRRMNSEDTVELFDRRIDDTTKYGFGCHGAISGIYTTDDENCADDDPDHDAMCKELQSILVDDDAIIIMEAGHEKLRYVSAHGIIITKKCIEYVSLASLLHSKSCDLLSNPEFSTQMDY